MTKKEAIQAMQEGEKVTHKYFVKGEYIAMEGDTIVCEKGFTRSSCEFWKYRQNEIFDDGWSICTPT